MIAFQEYLEAKVGLDARSRNAEVYAAFLAGLRARSGRPLRVLDVGSGTGAMIRRLAGEELGDAVELVAYDRDAASLAVARRKLGDAGRARVRFVRGDILEEPFDPRGPGGPFDAVMAHAFLDIVPLDRTLDRFRALLAPEGLLYATITYDGRTALVPPLPGFEEELLETYDRSMDERRAGGAPTGGSRAGTRLLAALPAAGFAIRGCGASDWSLYPFGGSYRGGEALFLQAILETMHAEGGRQGMPRAALDAWLEARLADLRRSRLGLIVHQLDVLAALSVAQPAS